LGIGSNKLSGGRKKVRMIFHNYIK